MAQAPDYDYDVVSSILDIFKVCSTKGKQLLASHTPQRLSYPCKLAYLHDSQILTHLGQLHVCGDITMAQAPCYDVVSSIWNLYKVCSIIGK